MALTIGTGLTIGGGITFHWIEPPAPWTWDPAYVGRPGIILSNGNLVATAIDTMTGEPSVLGTYPIPPNSKVMFSVCALAVTTNDVSAVGVGSHAMDLNDYVGSNFTTSQGVYEDGVNYTQTQNPNPTGLTYASLSTIDVAIDRVNGLFWYRTGQPGNMSFWNNNDGADPATATGGYPISNLVGTVYPAVGPYYVEAQNPPNGSFGANSQPGGTVPAGFTFIAATAPAWYWNSLGSEMITTFSGRTVYDNAPGTYSALGNYAVGDTARVVYSVQLTWDDDPSLPQNQSVGFGLNTTNLEAGLGTDDKSMAVLNTGEVYWSDIQIYSGLPTFSQGDVIDVALTGTYVTPGWWYRVNGGDWNGDPTADPATNTGGLTQYVDDTASPLYPAVSIAGSSGPSVFTIQDVPIYAVPSGFTFLGISQVRTHPLPVLSFDSGNPASYTGLVDGSAQFNGSNWLSMTPGVTIGSGAYTVECFVYFQSANLPGVILSSLTPGNSGFSLLISDATTIHIDQDGVAANNYTVPTMADNTWHHIAVTRNSIGEESVFVDGLQSSTGVTTTNYNFSGASSAIGKFNTGGQWWYTGSAAQIRAVVGNNVYDPNAATITVPINPLTDVSGTELLLLAANSAGLLTDSSGTQTLTNNNTVSWSAASPLSSNTWYDLAGSDNATMPNGVTYSTNNGGILTFNRSLSQSAHAGALPTLTTFTAETWVKFNNLDITSGNATCTITEVYSSTTINYNIGCGMLGNTSLWQGGYFDGGAWHLAGTLVPVVDTWYCMAVTYDGANLNFYVNGELNDTVASAVTPSSSGLGIHIGERWDTPYYTQSFLDGSIPIVRLYNTALSSLEIQQNFAADQARFPNLVTNGLILNVDAGNTNSYPGTGGTWYDLSGVGNNTSLEGSAPWTSAGDQSYFTFNSGYADASYILPNTAYTKIGIFRVAGNYNNLMSGAGNSAHAFWGAGTQYLQSGHNGNWSTVVSSVVTPVNQWVFGAVTFDSTTGWKLYLNNNAPVTSANTDQFGDNPALVYIGAYATGNNLGGDVAASLIYNRALTPAEIAQNFAYYRGRFGI